MRQVVVFISSRDADSVREVIARTGTGRLGNYTESVSRALTPCYGAPKALDERKIEFACDDETYSAIVAAIHDSVPSFAATVDSWSMETLAYAR